MLAKDTLLDNRYRIVELLGTGAMGSVYLALDERLSCNVAVKGTILERLKLNQKTEGELRQAFEREAKLLANLQHESVPRVSDFFEYENEQFFVMEYVTGEDLYEQAAKMRERGKNFEVKTVMDWACQLLDALSYLHTQPAPVIHKDIKLSNIKITQRSKVKLLDFGVSKGFAGEMTRVDAGSLQMGTESYAPLEQFLKFPSPAATTLRQALDIKHGDKVQKLLNEPTDARSDLYSLGVTLYRLLTDKSPADYLPRALAVWEGKADPLVPIHAHNSEVPETVSEIIMQSLALEKQDRPESAAAMRFYLEQAWRESQERTQSGAVVRLEQQLFEERTLRQNAEQRLQEIGNLQTPASVLPRFAARSHLLLIFVCVAVLSGLAFTWQVREFFRERASHIQPSQGVAVADETKLFNFVNRAEEHCNKKEFDEANRLFDEVLRQKEDYDFLYEKRGYCYEKQGKISEALTDYNRALTLDDDDAWTYFRRGVIHLLLQEDEKAVTDFSQVVEITPQDWAAYANRSAAYARLGKNDLARADLKRSNELERRAAKKN